jgi:phosphate/sulfate permease
MSVGSKFSIAWRMLKSIIQIWHVVLLGSMALSAVIYVGLD